MNPSAIISTDSRAGADSAPPAARSLFLVLGAVALTALTSACMSPLTFSLGRVEMVILPLSFAFALAVVMNTLSYRAVGASAMAGCSNLCSRALPISMLPFLAQLGATVGRGIDQVIAAGPALILQELGHFLGTIALSFPVAVWVLRLGRETIGATFSIARETSVAIIAQRYGLRSAEGNGVLGIYIIGTLFGTLVFSTIASLFASSEIFSSRALAVACGIGSGSMTAACAGALGTLRPSEADEILALAAASNLLAAILGFYVTYFGTLPLTRFLYDRVHPDSVVTPAPDQSDDRPAIELPDQASAVPDTRVQRGVAVCLGLLLIIVAAVASSGALWLKLAGAGLLVGVSGVSFALAALTKQRLPSMFWAPLGGIVLTTPWHPLGLQLASLLQPVDLLSLAIVPLVLAGFALNSVDWRNAKRIGWKLFVVAMCVFLGTFVGAAVIAEWSLRW